MATQRQGSSRQKKYHAKLRTPSGLFFGGRCLTAGPTAHGFSGLLKIPLHIFTSAAALHLANQGISLLVKATSGQRVNHKPISNQKLRLLPPICLFLPRVNFFFFFKGELCSFLSSFLFQVWPIEMYARKYRFSLSFIFRFFSGYKLMNAWQSDK